MRGSGCACRNTGAAGPDGGLAGLAGCGGAGVADWNRSCGGTEATRIGRAGGGVPPRRRDPPAAWNCGAEPGLGPRRGGAIGVAGVGAELNSGGMVGPWFAGVTAGSWVVSWGE